jgi:hypothetical protein
MKNCVFADEHNILDKLDHLFRNREALAQMQRGVRRITTGQMNEAISVYPHSCTIGDTILIASVKAAPALWIIKK